MDADTKRKILIFIAIACVAVTLLSIIAMHFGWYYLGFLPMFFLFIPIGGFGGRKGISEGYSEDDWCPECGNEVSPDDSFCTVCGRNLR